MINSRETVPIQPVKKSRTIILLSSTSTIIINMSVWVKGDMTFRTKIITKYFINSFEIICREFHWTLKWKNKVLRKIFMFEKQ